MATDTNVKSLVLNRMTKAQYDAATKSTTELYLVPDSSKPIYYGTCSTAAGTAAKVVVCEGFVLETGATVRVKFTNANSHNGTATLNVNSTGAKNITRAGGTTSRYWWTANEVVDFVYNGTTWDMVDKGAASTTYYGLTRLSDSTSSTSTSLAATANAVKKAYDLANGKQDPLTAGTGIQIQNNVISTTTQPFQYQVISEDNYQALIDAGTVDENTLYFIKES